jgi:hypothetical protein
LSIDVHIRSLSGSNFRPASTFAPEAKTAHRHRRSPAGSETVE